MSLKQQFKNSKVLIHPGETLQEYLDKFNISQIKLAEITSFTHEHISRVIEGKEVISKEFALKLEHALGVPAYFWINLQRNYDFESQ